MSRFWFHWADKTDTTFSPAFITDDEDVFAVSILHSEGDIPSMEVDILNPRVGLLTTGRKQWAWLSWTDDGGTNHPLFFGRIVGVPQQLQDETIRLTFVARALNIDAQKLAIYEDVVNNSPVYDAIWYSDEDQIDPDAILEVMPSLWHIDRTSLEVTLSDIIEGEDGTVAFGGDEVFYDSVSVTYSQTPARQCVVNATVNWTQAGAGSLDLTNKIIEAFKNSHQEKGLASARGNPVSGNGIIAIIPGEDMLNSWPKAGDSFGGGWTVSASSIEVVGDPPPEPVLLPSYEAFDQISAWLDTPNLVGIAMRHIFESQPGFLAQVNPTWVFPTMFGTAHGEVEVVWFPIWRLAPQLEVAWDVARPRTENISFTLTADVQPLLSDPGESEIIRLNVGTADVDDYIGDVRRARYFVTDRGQQSLLSLIARARAALLARARAVDVEFDVPFETAIGLSCRMNGAFEDARLGGPVGGKIKAYSLTADGSSGKLNGHVVLGCTVGRAGSVVAVPGTPGYAEEGYMEEGYQVYTGATFNLPGYTDLTYALGDYAFSNDGVSLFNVHLIDYLESITVTGTIDEQQEEAQTVVGGQGQTYPEMVSKVKGFRTDVEVRMRPILNNSFVTEVTPSISELKVPRTMDLESV